MELSHRQQNAHRGLVRVPLALGTNQFGSFQPTPKGCREEGRVQMTAKHQGSMESSIYGVKLTGTCPSALESPVVYAPQITKQLRSAQGERMAASVFNSNFVFSLALSDK